MARDGVARRAASLYYGTSKMRGGGPFSTIDRVSMFVSIIVPCFNAALTIGATIESALEQWDVGVEIIVLDDGSTDRSLEITRTFEPRVRVLAGANQGPSIARNRGIAATTGEWLVFLDADDLLVPGTLRRRLETAEATGADVVVCDWQEFVDRDGRNRGQSGLLVGYDRSCSRRGSRLLYELGGD